VLRAERDKAAGTAGVAIGQQEKSRALEDELKGQIENLRGQLSAAEREAVTGKQRIRELEEEVKVVKARMSDAESLEAMIRQKDAAIEEVKQRHIDFTTKTTAAMRALSTDLSEVSLEFPT
jgi:translation initiation factor 2B subunit (eIF-2B alpha/beta/delta family)